MEKALLSVLLLACRPSTAVAEDPPPQAQVYTRTDDGRFVLQGQDPPPDPVTSAKVVRTYTERRAALNLPVGDDPLFQSFQSFLADPSRADQLQSLTLGADGLLTARFEEDGVEADFTFTPGSPADPPSDPFSATPSQVSFRDPQDPEGSKHPLVRRADGTLGPHPDHEIPQGELKLAATFAPELLPVQISVTVRDVSSSLPSGAAPVILNAYESAYDTLPEGVDVGETYWLKREGEGAVWMEMTAEGGKERGWRTSVTVGGETQYLVFDHGVDAHPGDLDTPPAAGLKDLWRDRWVLRVLPKEGAQAATEIMKYAELDLNRDQRYLRTIGTRQEPQTRYETVGCGRGSCTRRRIDTKVSVPIVRVDLTGSLHALDAPAHTVTRTGSGLGPLQTYSPSAQGEQVHAFRFNQPWGTYRKGRDTLPLQWYKDASGTEYRQVVPTGGDAPVLAQVVSGTQVPGVTRDSTPSGTGPETVEEAVQVAWNELSQQPGLIDKAKTFLESFAADDGVSGLLESVGEDGVSDDDFNGLLAALHSGRFQGDPHTAAQVFIQLASVEGDAGLTGPRLDALLALVADASSNENGRLAAAEALPGLARRRPGSADRIETVLLAGLRQERKPQVARQLAAGLVDMGRPQGLAGLFANEDFRKSPAALPAAHQLVRAMDRHSSALHDHRDQVLLAADLVLDDLETDGSPSRNQPGTVTSLAALFGRGYGEGFEHRTFDLLVSLALDDDLSDDANTAAIDAFSRFGGAGSFPRRMQAFASLLKDRGDEGFIRTRALRGLVGQGDSAVAYLLPLAEGTQDTAARRDVRAALLAFEPENDYAAVPLAEYYARRMLAEPDAAGPYRAALLKLTTGSEPILSGKDLQGTLALFAGLKRQGNRWTPDGASPSAAGLAFLRDFAGGGLPADADPALRELLIVRLSGPLRLTSEDDAPLRVAAAEGLLALFPRDRDVHRVALEPLLKELDFDPAAYFEAAAARGRTLLREDDPDVQATLKALAALGPGERDAASMPLPMFASTEEPPALAAVRALGLPGLDVAADPLADMLAHPDARVRLAAADSLARIGPSAEYVRAQLMTAAVTDPNAEVQQAALAALQKVDPDNALAYAAAPGLFNADAPTGPSSDGRLVLLSDLVVKPTEGEQPLVLTGPRRPDRETPLLLSPRLLAGRSPTVVSTLLDMPPGRGRDVLLDQEMARILRLSRNRPNDPEVTQTAALLAQRLETLRGGDTNILLDPAATRMLGWLNQLSGSNDDRALVGGSIRLFLDNKGDTITAPELLQLSTLPLEDPEAANSLELIVRSPRLGKDQRGAALWALQSRSLLLGDADSDLSATSVDLSRRFPELNLRGSSGRRYPWSPSSQQAGFSPLFLQDDSQALVNPFTRRGDPFSRNPFLPFSRPSPPTLAEVQWSMTPGGSVPAFVNPGVARTYPLNRVPATGTWHVRPWTLPLLRE